MLIANVTCVNGSFTVEGEGGSGSLVSWEEAPTMLGTDNTIGHAQLPKEQSTWMQQSQHTREDNMYNTQRMSQRECNGCLLGVEPDYLLYSKVSLHWTPVHNVAAMPPIIFTL